MSVIITGIDIPDKCQWECPFCNGEGGECLISNEWTSNETRPDGCPLKSIDGLIEAINDHRVMSFYTKEHAISKIKEYCEMTEQRNLKVGVIEENRKPLRDYLKEVLSEGEDKK